MLGPIVMTTIMAGFCGGPGLDAYAFVAHSPGYASVLKLEDRSVVLSGLLQDHSVETRLLSADDLESGSSSTTMDKNTTHLFGMGAEMAATTVVYSNTRSDDPWKTVMEMTHPHHDYADHAVVLPPEAQLDMFNDSALGCDFPVLTCESHTEFLLTLDASGVLCLSPRRL